MAKQYRLHSYDVRPRVGDENAEGAHAHMDQMVADGWVIHTANVTYPEASILWERDAPEEAEGPAPAREAAQQKAGTAKERGRRAGAPSG
jgi:hypothetical protein